MKNDYPYLTRTLILCLITVLISMTLLTRLAYLQLRIELPTQQAAAAVYTRSYTELASRGEIADRNGTPLVSNTLGFNIELDYYNWDKTRQNAVILELCQILSQAGVEYKDTLPLTQTVPYEYTYEGEESQAYRTLAKLIAAQEDWPENPSPSTLFTLLCQRYEVDIDLGLWQKRVIIGVRYYLENQQFSAYNTPVLLANDVEISTVAHISELSLDLPGVTIQVDDIRQYNTVYAAHILGRVGAINADQYATLKNEGYKLTDTLGTEGMEQALESYLRGIDGTRNVEVSRTTGQVVQEYILDEPAPGDNCYLTIDLELQQVAEDALASTLAYIKAQGEASKDGKGADVEGGALVVLDANTGEILAMASYPTFNQSTYVQDLAENNQNPLSPLYNRAIRSAYPPGSTFKMVTALAALESGLITPATKIRDEGVFTAYESPQPKCWIYNRYYSTHGLINVSEALAYSCNYFFYDVAYRMGIDVLNQYGRALGLGKKTGVELALEAAGTLDGPEARQGMPEGWAWYDGVTLSAAIGQAGQQLTPLQLANYVATIVNGGTRYQPHLLKTVVDYTGTRIIHEAQPVVMDRLDLKDSTINAIKDGMRGVVTDDGTASSYFRNFPLEVGGKTGSAETYGDRSAHGVFVSFAPFDQPEIVVVAIGEFAGSGGIMSPACMEVYKHYFNLAIEDPIEITSIDTAITTDTPDEAEDAPPIEEEPRLPSVPDTQTNPASETEEPPAEPSVPTQSDGDTQKNPDSGQAPPEVPSDPLAPPPQEEEEQTGEP